MRQQKVLFLQDFSLERIGGGSSILKRLIKYADEYNFVVCSAFDVSANKKVNKVNSSEKTFFTLPRSYRFGIGRLIGCLTIFCLDILAIISLVRLIKREAPDVIHLTAHGASFPVTALAAMICRVKTVLSVHDLWHLTVAGFIPPFLCHFVFRIAIRNINTVYVISTNMSKYLTEKYGKKNYQVMHDGVAKQENNGVVQNMHKTGFSFLYVGIIHSIQVSLFSKFVDALGRFKEKQFTIGVFSSDNFVPENLYGNIKITNYGWVEEKKIKEISSNYNYGLLPLSFEQRDELLYRTSLMTKIPFYISVSLPILCIGPSNSSSVDIIQKEGVGETITSSHVDEIENALGKIFNNFSNKTGGYQKNLKRSAETTFNIELLAKKFYQNMPDYHFKQNEKVYYQSTVYSDQSS